jgi:hypothetical protein
MARVFRAATDGPKDLRAALAALRAPDAPQRIADLETLLADGGRKGRAHGAEARGHREGCGEDEGEGEVGREEIGLGLTA